MPALTIGTAVVVNAGGTALTNTVGTLALAGNFATTGAFSTTLAAQASVTLTLPAASGTLATLAGTESLSNKTIVAPVLSGSVTGTYTLAGTPTIASPTITGATITGSTLNGNTFTTGSGTLTIAGSKTVTVNNTLTIGGTDGTTMTFPTTSATLARIDAANTFTGTQTFGALVYTTLNGNTWATGTGTLSIGAGKTLTASNSLILAGSDSTTMTFPSTSATIARTDAANTFTGHQTIEGVTSTGATGTGNLVFSVAPAFTGTVTGAALTFSGVVKGAQVWQSSRNAFYSGAGFSPAATASGTVIMMGLGSTWTITPSFSGRVKVLVTGYSSNDTINGVAVIACSFNSGSAPAYGAAGTGSNIMPSLSDTAAVANGATPFTIYGEATGLSLATAYWFDMNLRSGGVGGSSLVVITSVRIEEF